MIRLLSLLTFFSQFAYSAPLAVYEAWDPDSDPAIMQFFHNKKFNELPLSGSLNNSRKLWSGDYWPLNRGNINYRWFAKNKIGFNLKSPTKEEASRMGLADLAELSPSEKYDLFIGRYDYPLKSEVSNIANPKALIWEGICHGWSPATINHNEPSPKVVFNPDGIEIPFGSTDIKALLSYYYAHVYVSPDTHQMGKRCYNYPMRMDERDCLEDMNAGAFHIVLANRVGLEGKSLVADLKRYNEVWNHPIVAYESRPIATERPHQKSAHGTVKTLRLKTTVTYLDDNGNDWHPVKGTFKQKNMYEYYEYRLDINNAGEIIGGNWISNSRPDFLWYSMKARSFNGIFSRLDELLDDE